MDFPTLQQTPRKGIFKLVYINTASHLKILQNIHAVTNTKLQQKLKWSKVQCRVIHSLAKLHLLNFNEISRSNTETGIMSIH